MQAAVAAAIAPAAPEVTMPGFGAGELRQTLSHGALQFEHMDEMIGRCLLGPADRRQLERAAQVSPRAAPVDEGPDSNPAIDVS